MRINLFEGGRRLGAVLIWLTALIGVAIVLDETDGVYAYYSVDSFGAEPRRVEDCARGDESRLGTKVTPKGRTINVFVCFKHETADNGQLGIAFMRDGDRLLLHDRHHQSVMEYTARVTDNLPLPQDELETLDQEWMWTQAKAKATAAGALVLVILGMLITARIAGWIARGFLGIPPGQDSRPT